MTFINKINIIDEALISKQEIKKDPKMIETLADSFDLEKYKGVRRNILRPLFKKIADTYGVPLKNNGKTIIFDFNNLMIEKDTTMSRQLSTTERTMLSNLLFRYNYVFDETLFLIGNAKKRNGHLESLINIFDKISDEIKNYQKFQNEKDRNTIKEKKLQSDIEKLDKDKKFLMKSEIDRKVIKLSKEEALKKISERNTILKEKLENLQKDEEAFTKLQEKIYMYKDINYKILITYIPWRVAAMSTFSSNNAPWDSCMNLEHGVNSGFVGSSISNGAFVAYLIRPGDEDNIENPLARVLIKPFIKVEKEEDDDEYSEEEDEYGEYHRRYRQVEYAEIDYIDKNKLGTDVFWYVDLVYPRGQYGSFRSKVVSIFNKINSNVEKGDFVISKGQYADSKEKVNIDDVFIYMNNGDYSDIATKNSTFISKMLKEYPFEFFSNWPEKEPIPKDVIINADIKLENMDIRKLPEGLVVNGDLIIDNINIRKISNAKCKRLVLKNNSNLVSVDNCEMKKLHIENNKKLSNIENNKFLNLEIINCKKINKLDNLSLKTLKVHKKEKNDSFIFGNNLIIDEELNLINFKIENYGLFKNIKILNLVNVEMNSLSGNYEQVFIKPSCIIKSLDDLKVKYALEIDTAQIETLNNVSIDSTFSLDNVHIKSIKNLQMRQTYQSPTNRYVGCSINCKNLEIIENVSAEYFLSFYNLNNVKIINNLSCDSDMSFRNCDFTNFNNINNFKIKCKKLTVEKCKAKTIKNIEIEKLGIIESEISEVSDINCESEFEIQKTDIDTIKNIKAKYRIFINNLKIKNIIDIDSQIIYLNKIRSDAVVDLNNKKIEKINMYNSYIEEIKNGVINDLVASDHGFVSKLSNIHIKGELKLFGTDVTEIGKNVIFGTEERETSRYRINFINSKKVSKDFKIFGDATWYNNEIEILPFMTVKGTLTVTSDILKDVTEGAEIDKLNIFGDKKMFRDDLDKVKLISKIKTLKT